MRSHERGEYILGTDARELARLRFQHQAWVEQGYALWTRAGLRAGDTVLDLGCGPGFTSLELAHVVGAEGRVIARDQSESFLAFLRHECAQRPQCPVEASLGAVETLDLPAGSLDAAYSRWLFCWLPEPEAALQRVARMLRPNGALVLHEYLDWGAMRLMPHGPAFARAVEVCLASWQLGGGDINFAARVPELALRVGLAIEHFAPIARVGGVGSLEWRWLGDFFQGYLPRVEERGLLTAAERAAWEREWAARTAAGDSFVLAPTMAGVILRQRG
jgi:SAM-dependent methyltransferase